MKVNDLSDNNGSVMWFWPERVSDCLSEFQTVWASTTCLQFCCLGLSLGFFFYCILHQSKIQAPTVISENLDVNH